MELKKSEEANVDKQRLPLVAIGFLFIGSLVLASFSYTAGVERSDANKGAKKSSALKFVEEEQPKDETPPPPTPPQIDAPPPPQEEIIEKKNEETEPVTNPAPPPPPIPKGPETKGNVVAEIIDFPDVEASFPGGPAELQKYIIKNMNYPQMAIENGDQGKVFLSFVVEPDGSITGITVVRGVSDDIDREAKRVLRSMPPWIPGEAGGKKARTRCQMPINFTLQ